MLTLILLISHKPYFMLSLTKASPCSFIYIEWPYAMTLTALTPMKTSTFLKTYAYLPSC